MLRALIFLIVAVALGRAAQQYVPSSSRPPEPAQEFRGAWVATVKNIDWPSKPGLSTAEQQSELLAILDRARALNLNAVILQVRPACDALYASKLEPWSEYLTGTMGKAPKPFWDPLEFAVREAHARGLELHAWFNPFRARHSSGKTPLASTHLGNTKPALVKKYGTHLWLDPGLQEVHDHSMRVILDVVKRYDIDGVHLDDYFYPYREKDASGQLLPFPDSASWNSYVKTGGKLARDDWRRDNVNRFLSRMYREVKQAKPWVEVGISPFGIYRPGYPEQIKGFDQYESLYADPRTWLANGWLDYIAPQLYWRIDPPAQSFPVLLKWWAENNPKNRWIIPGMASSSLALSAKDANPASSRSWPASEITRQIEITRQQSGVQGHIHWNMSALMKNRGGINEHLGREPYKQAAVWPVLQKTAQPLTKARLSGRELKGNQARIDWTAGKGEKVRFWLLQAKHGDSWTSQVLPNTIKGFQFKHAPAMVSVRPIDAYGNLGPASTLERAKQAVQARQ